MADKNDGGPAFPVLRSLRLTGDSTPDYPEYDAHTEDGLSVRDYFAGQAMLSLIPEYQNANAAIAKEAYKIADAMLKAREQ